MLSVIVPVFNERQTVAELLERVAQVPLEKEIVVVDDASTDGTAEILAAFAQRPGFRVLRHERNGGKGRAIRTGLEVVTGSVVVIQDADLEYDPADFVPMIEPIRAGRHDAVFGSRRLKKSNRQYAGPIYYAGGVALSWLTRLLYGIAITDEPTCYKMVKTDLLRSLDLQCERFEFCPEVTAKLARRGVKILEIPITYRPRHKSEGKKIGWKDAVEAGWTLLKYRFSGLERPAFAWPKLACAAALVVGALLRFSGLSHDLHEGRMYHPDAPKQIRAAQEYLHGEYYRHIGHKDYDGYPLFHARLVEGVVRVAEPVRQRTLHLFGIPSRPGALADIQALYWILLLLNAALSTATIGLVFAMGRENFGAVAGSLAAGLMAISPADLTAAHLATGDAVTAFFAAWSLVHSFRVLRLGRRRDYVLAAVMGTFAFAAKYYAATCFITLAVAHLARSSSWRPADWFRGDGWRNIALAAAASVGALFIAVPGLWSHFVPQVQDIVQAMFVSTQRFPAELKLAGRGAKFVYSMQVNLPDFVRCVTPVTLVAGVLAVASKLRRDARVWVLLVAPILYVLLAVGSRGPVNAVYHTAVTPPLFLLVGFVCLWLASIRVQPRGAAPAAAGALACLSAGLLLPDTARETFFARHEDTRRIADTWAEENVPASFTPKKSRYSFDRDRAILPGGPEGILILGSGLDPLDERLPAIGLARMALERHPLTQFRNIEQRIEVGYAPSIRPGFHNPSLVRAPSTAGNDFLFDSAPDFSRSPKILEVAPGHPASRWLVADRPVTQVWIFASSPVLPARARVSLDGERCEMDLRTNDSAVCVVAHPAPRFPSHADLRFHPVAVRARTNPVHVVLATTAAEAGLGYAELGRAAEATPLLVRTAIDRSDPAFAARALDCARTAGIALPPADAAAVRTLAARAADVRDDDSLFAVYGLRAAYIESLPFLDFAATGLVTQGFAPVEVNLTSARTLPVTELVARRRLREEADASGAPYAISTPTVHLAPGHYTATFFARNPDLSRDEAQTVFHVSDTAGHTLHEEPVVPPPLDARLYAFIRIPFAVPEGVRFCRVGLRSGQRPAYTIGGLEIRPDVVANARDLGERARVALAAAAGRS